MSLTDLIAYTHALLKPAGCTDHMGHTITVAFAHDFFLLGWRNIIYLYSFPTLENMGESYFVILCYINLYTTVHCRLDVRLSWWPAMMVMTKW